MNRVLALVETYFGDQARQWLSTLYEQYSGIGEELDQFVREVSRRDEDEVVRVRPVGTRLSALGHSVYRFNVLVLRSIHNETAPIPAPVAPASGLVRFGDKGPRVRELQNVLRARGATIAADGIFGLGTEEAVRESQRESNLPIDGIVGPATRTALGIS